MTAPQVRILVLRGGAIGDFIVTLPALRALRRQWPEAYIELAGYPHVARLALEGGIVDRVTSLDASHMARFFALRPMFTEEQALHVRGFNIVLSYLHDPEGSLRDNLKAAGASLVIHGSPLVREGHAADQMMRPLSELAIYDDAAVPSLELGAVSRERGRALLDGIGAAPNPLAIHPGSGSPKKNWPLERFVELARRGGRPLLFVAGEADEELLPPLRAALPDAPLLAGRSLDEVAGALSHCSAYVGNDSGITHLAAALGVHTVALFGPSDAAAWGPRGRSVRILTAPGGDLSRLGANDVLSALGP